MKLRKLRCSRPLAPGSLAGQLLAEMDPVDLDERMAAIDAQRADAAAERVLAAAHVPRNEQMARPCSTPNTVVTHGEKIIPTFGRLQHIRDGRTALQQRALAA